MAWGPCPPGPARQDPIPPAPHCLALWGPGQRQDLATPSRAVTNRQGCLWVQKQVTESCF